MNKNHKKLYTINNSLKGSLAFLQHFKFVNWWIRGFIALMSRTSYFLTAQTVKISGEKLVKQIGEKI